MKKFVFFIAVLIACIGTSRAQYFTVGDLTYEVINQDNNWVAVDDCSSGFIGTATIPSVVSYENDNYSVVAIGNLAFEGCALLSGVSIPTSITSIGDGAFSMCVGLTSVTIPQTVTSLGEDAFAVCYSLTEITIPFGISVIEEETFAMCTGLTQVTFQGAITEIGNKAFLFCSSLLEINLPSSLTSIGAGAFSGCGNLTEVEIPQGVNSIGTGPFSICGLLQEIIVEEGNLNYISSEGVLFNIDQTTLIQYPAGKSNEFIIPDSVTRIEDLSFEGCTNLRSILLPSSITDIGESAFFNCESLSLVACQAIEPPTVNSNSFEQAGIDSLLVDLASLEDYQNAPVWQDFNHIIGLSMSVELVEDIDIKIYPNPASNWLRVEGAENSIIRIVDLGGRLIDYYYNRSTIDISNLAKGSYILQIIEGKSVQTIPFNKI